VWEEVLLPQLDNWLGAIFHPESIERDLDRIIAALDEPDEAHAATLAALRNEERRVQTQVENLRRAIADGADSEAIVRALNDAQARVKAAQNRRAAIALPAPKVNREEMMEALGGALDVATVLEVAMPAERAGLYRSCGVSVHGDHTGKEANTKVDLGNPGVGFRSVGGGT